MTYNSSTVNSWDDILATDNNNLRLDILDRAWEYTTSGGSSNAYTLSVDSQITAYRTWQRFIFKANHTNTWSATLNVNSIWAKTLKDKDWNSLWSWAILINSVIECIYNWTNLICVSGIIYNISNPWLLYSPYFWDWSDWDVTISTNTTLTRDMFYNNLTINNGYTLYPAWYKIFVKWTLTNNWTISRNWNNWWNGGNASSGTPWTWWSAGAALSSGALWECIWGVAWTWGGSWDWVNWLSSNPSYSNTNGVAWWWSYWGVSWWSAWTSTRWTYYNTYLTFQKLISLLSFQSSQLQIQSTLYKSIAWSWSWASWGWSGTNSAWWWGGWSGWVWWIIFISANTFDNTNWTIIATWGNWGNWGNWYCIVTGIVWYYWTWWGWWWGGSGWILFLAYKTLTAIWTVTLTWWTGGTKGLWYYQGVLHNGYDWANGSNWNAWTTIQVAIT